jgi:hypothetical protein
MAKKLPKNHNFLRVCVFVFFVSFSEKKNSKLGRFPKKITNTTRTPTVVKKFRFLLEISTLFLQKMGIL